MIANDDGYAYEVFEQVQALFQANAPLIEKIHKEEQRLNGEITRYDRGIADSQKKLKDTKKKIKLAIKARDIFKKKAVFLQQDTNEARMQLLQLRSKILLFEQDLEARNAEVASKDAAFRGTETNIDDQIQRVLRDIAHFEAVSGDSCRGKVAVIDACNYAQRFAYEAYVRWLKVWPVLQMWITSQAQHVITVNAVATLQGLTAEWSALRALALQMVELDELFRPSDLTALRKGPSVATKLSKFRKALRERHQSNIARSTEATKTVEQLERLRKRLKAIIFDLEKAIDGDVSTSRRAAEAEAVLPLNRALQLRGDGAADSNNHIPNTGNSNTSAGNGSNGNRLPTVDRLRAWRWLRSLTVASTPHAEVNRVALESISDDRVLPSLAGTTDYGAVRSALARLNRPQTQGSIDSDDLNMPPQLRSQTGAGGGRIDVDSRPITGATDVVQSQSAHRAKMALDPEMDTLFVDESEVRQYYDVDAVRVMVSSAEVRAAARRAQLSALAIGKLSLRKTHLSIDLAASQQTNVTSTMSAEVTAALVAGNPDMLGIGHGSTIASAASLAQTLPAGADMDNETVAGANNANPVKYLGFGDSASSSVANSGGITNSEGFKNRLRAIRQEELQMVDLLMQNNQTIQEWQAYNNCGIHAATALQRRFPCAPSVLPEAALNAARALEASSGYSSRIGTASSTGGSRGSVRMAGAGNQVQSPSSIVAGMSGHRAAIHHARTAQDEALARRHGHGHGHGQAGGHHREGHHGHGKESVRSAPELTLPGPQNDPDHYSTSQKAWGVLEFQKAVRIDGDMLNLSLYWQEDLERFKLIARSFLQGKLEEYVILLKVDENLESCVRHEIKSRQGLGELRPTFYKVLLNKLHIEIIGIPTAQELAHKALTIGLDSALKTLPKDVFVADTDSVVRILTLRNKDGDLTYCVFPKMVSTTPADTSDILSINSK